MNKLWFIILFKLSNIYSQSDTLFSKLAFGKNVTTFYFGAGGSSRYLDLNYFGNETIQYRRSPYVVLGFDHCVFPKGSNAYWGVGPYLSSWYATKHYLDDAGNTINSSWSSSLISVKVTHHNSFFVRKKLDMCSAIILGSRVKYYHFKEINNLTVLNDIEKVSVLPAFGVSGTIRYYFYKNIAFYGEIGLGYKIDFATIGLAYKFKKRSAF